MNNEPNEFIAEKHTDNNRKENTDQNDYDEHRKSRTANQMQQLKDCETFSEMQIVCSEFPTESLDGHDRYILGDSLRVCEASIDLYPDDVPYDTNCFPVEVRANGDCLTACGSVFVHGRDTLDFSPDEIRLNIIKELVSHKDSYLIKEYLSRGLACPQKTILKRFAMYSD